MAEALISPGLQIRENDISFLSPATIQAGAAIIGPTVKGPVEIPTLVTSYSEYQRVFGTTFSSGSNSYEYFTSLAAKDYFSRGGTSILVTRVVPSGSTFTSATSTDIDPTAGTGNPFTLETIGEGTIFNNSTGAADPGVENSDGSLKSGSVDNIRWEISNVNTAQGTFTISVRRGDDNTKNKLIVETFNNVSLDPNSGNYIEKVIGNQVSTKTTDGDLVYIEVSGEYPNRSRYIRVASVDKPTPNYLGTDGKTIGVDGTGASYTGSLPVAQSGSFYGATGDLFQTGVNNFFGDITAANTQGFVGSEYADAISILSNSDEYQFNLITAPGLINNFASHVTAINSLVSMVEERGDCMAVLDMVEYGSSTSTVAAEAEDINSSYVASYWPWLQVASSTGKNVWVPASVVIPGMYSFSDSLGAPWYAPGGTLRGGLVGVIQPERKLTKAQKNELYAAGVNPIATIPGYGLAVYGQKTLQKKESALNRVGVRRLVMELKKFVGNVAKDLILTDQNTAATRNKFEARVRPYMDSVVERSGLYAYDILIDDSLNTPDVIDRNEMIVRIRIQPTRTIEYVYLDFILTPTGVDFGA